MNKAAALIVGSLFWLLTQPLAEAATRTAAKKTSVALKVAAPRGKKKPSPVAASGQSGMTAEVMLAEVDQVDDFGLRGHASFYGHGFQGRKTSTGERFDVRSFTAASNRFPLGSKVAVRRLDNDRCAIVVVNDRMHEKHRRRIIDVSRGVAEYLEMIRAGVVLVKVAPLRAGASDKGLSACSAAFEPDTASELVPASPGIRMPVFDWPRDGDSAAP